VAASITTVVDVTPELQQLLSELGHQRAAVLRKLDALSEEEPTPCSSGWHPCRVPVTFLKRPQITFGGT
jgi:hypothetical protein